MILSSVPVLFITGPVGVGKTTVASEITELLNDLGVPHARVDMDALRDCHPSPAHDPFHEALGVQNLAAIWPNFRAAGAERLIVVSVLETRSELKYYREAIPGAEIVVIRLQASLDTLVSRVEGRNLWSGREWHLRRTAELAAQIARDHLEDILIDTDGKSPVAIAQEILEQTGWGMPNKL